MKLHCGEKKGIKDRLSCDISAATSHSVRMKMQSLYGARLMDKPYKCLSFLRPTMWNISHREEILYVNAVFVICPLYPQLYPVSAYVFLDTSLSSIATSWSLLWPPCALWYLMKSWSHSLIDVQNEIQPDVWPSPCITLVYHQLIAKYFLQKDPKPSCKESKFSDQSSPTCHLLAHIKMEKQRGNSEM